MQPALTNAERRKLKADSQRLKAVLKVGRSGLSAAFIQVVADTLNQHELVKIRFDDFKAEKQQLSRLLAEQTDSELIWMVGHVAVLYRRKPESPAA